MPRRSKSATSSSLEAPTDDTLTTEQRRARMSKCQVMVERSICTTNFCNYNFEGHTIH